MERIIRVDDIQRIVAAHFGFDRAFMKSPDRARKYARPRQIAIALSREMGRKSMPDLGRRFGNRDHTTILASCRRVESLCRDDADICSLVDGLRSVVSNHEGWPVFFAAAAICNMRVVRYDPKPVKFRKMDIQYPDRKYRPFMRSALKPAQPLALVTPTAAQPQLPAVGALSP